MALAERTFVSRCSFVARPINVWTGKPPTDSALVVRLKESARPPIRTSDGCYAFLDAVGRQCTLTLSSPYYLPAEIPLDLDAYESSVPTIDVLLCPNRLYPPPAGATGFQFRILDERGVPVHHASVTASIAGKSKSSAETSVSTWSDERGCVVLPVPGPLPQGCVVKADIEYGKIRKQAEWKPETGAVVHLPDFRLGH